MSELNRRIDWYRVHVDTEVLRELTRARDSAGLLQAGGHLLLVLLTGSLVVLVSLKLAWYWILPALMVHGTVVSTFGAACHELSHERVFATRWLNRLFLNVFSFLVWDNPRLYSLSHNDHHRFTLHQPEDLEVVLPQRTTFWHLLLLQFVDLKTISDRIATNVVLAFGKARGEWHTQLLKRAEPTEAAGVYRWSRGLLAGHLVMLAVSIASGLWVLPLVVTFGRAFGAGLIMLMGLPQHMGLVDAVNDFRLSCRTYYLNPVCGFLYWHMNYHIEHHMYPAVPCYHLARLHAAIRHELPHCPRGLFETWVQISDTLIKQKYDPDYQFRAALPTDQVPMAVAASEPQGSSITMESSPTTASIVWECSWCGFIYDEAEGLPEEGIAPGTRWEDIPEDWVCPVCGVAKAQFEMVQIDRKLAETKPRKSI